MWVTRTVEDILKIANIHAEEADQDERLVSIVVAPPASPIWTELDKNVSYLNDRSGGPGWDLFFAGYGPGGADSKILRGDRSSQEVEFSPEGFKKIVLTIESAHEKALSQSPLDFVSPWRFTGKSVILNVLYRHGILDWATLTNFDMDLLGSAPLSQVVERLAPWVDGFDPELFPDLSMLNDPGKSIGRGVFVSALINAAKLKMDEEATGWMNAMKEFLGGMYS